MGSDTLVGSGDEKHTYLVFIRDSKKGQIWRQAQIYVLYNLLWYYISFFTFSPQIRQWGKGVIQKWKISYLISLRKAWWCHQMETFSMLLTFCEGNPPVTSGFPSQRPVTRSCDVSLICAWTNGWANNWDAGSLRCLHTHYDATVMECL